MVRRSGLQPRPTAASVPAQSTARPLLAVSVLVGFLAATVCFGAIRLHAGTVAIAAGSPPAPSAVTTEIHDFTPHTFAPSAFADWADQAYPTSATEASPRRD